MDLTDLQRRRLVVLRHYHEYVTALHTTRLDSSSSQVQQARKALARAIEDACQNDPWILDDFKRNFAAPRS
jgi:hypothetical protein